MLTEKMSGSQHVVSSGYARMVDFYCITFLSILSELSVMSLYFGKKAKSYCFKFTEVGNLFSFNRFNFLKSGMCSFPTK